MGRQRKVQGGRLGAAKGGSSARMAGKRVGSGSSQESRPLASASDLTVTGTTKSRAMSKVKVFYATDSMEHITTYFKKHQVALIKQCKWQLSDANSFSLNTIKKLYKSAKDMIDKTFSIESTGEACLGATGESVLGTAATAPNGSWYASFIAQGLEHEERGLAFRNSLPLKEFPGDIKKVGDTDMTHTEPIWVFFGKNLNRCGSLLAGRAEHTDSVSHDGTWHYQAQGKKLWYIRPAESTEWGDVPVCVKSNANIGGDSSLDDGIGRLLVTVEEGDVLMINTRLWWHQTRIPYTGSRGMSISYARDFFSKKLCISGLESSEGAVEGSHSYSNIEGLYASRRVKHGEIVLTEDELPDCSLPRCSNPSCEIVWLDDGTGALLAARDLQVGDWLTVAPSDDDEDD